MNLHSRPFGRFFPIAVLIAWALAVPAIGEETAPSEYQVKAAFLVNFADFVAWPDGAFPTANAPLTFCVLGDDPFGAGLDAFAGASVQGRKVLIKRIRSLGELQNCQVLFVCPSESARLTAVLDAVAGRPVLTVGDTDAFRSAGGMISFLVLQDKVRFDVNLTAAQRERLRISSNLLKLAHRVME